MRRLFFATLCATALALAAPLVAQQRHSTPLRAVPSAVEGRALTAADYARAERFMAYTPTPLARRGGVRPTWLEGDRFWYRVATDRGPEFVLVDAAARTRGACSLPECKET